MWIIPAIDLRQGRCVRLVQGRFEDETVFSEDPIAVAQRWEAAGAAWLHVVNLDGALQQDSPNRRIVRQIVQSVQMPVQLGGGLRSLPDISHALDQGVARVILGTIALRQPEVVEQAIRQFSPQKIVVGIDAWERRVAIQAWQEITNVCDVTFARQMQEMGVVRCVYTDVSRDGTGAGPNVEATREVAERSGLKVIASGGIATLDHIRALLEMDSQGIEGAVVGRALYTGSLALGDALALADAYAAKRPRGNTPC